MMITYDILLGLILQYQVSTTVMDLIVVSASFVFMLALLRFCVATVNKDLYNGSFRGACVPGEMLWGVQNVLRSTAHHARRGDAKFAGLIRN